MSQSAHISVVCRIKAVTTEPDRAIQPVAPVVASVPAPVLSIRNDDYLALVDWTGRLIRGDRAGAIRADAPPVLAPLGLDARQWHTQVLGIESRYWRAAGCTRALVHRAAALGQRWLKGMRRAME